MKGEACDIATPLYDKQGNKLSPFASLSLLKEWFTWLMDNVNADQLILERASKTSSHYWIHISCKPDPTKNRHQVLFLTKK